MAPFAGRSRGGDFGGRPSERPEGTFGIPDLLARPAGNNDSDVRPLIRSRCGPLHVWALEGSSPDSTGPLKETFHIMPVVHSSRKVPSGLAGPSWANRDSDVGALFLLRRWARKTAVWLRYTEVLKEVCKLSNRATHPKLNAEKQELVNLRLGQLTVKG